MTNSVTETESDQ